MSKPLTVHMFAKIIFFKVPRETVDSIELPFKVEIKMSKSSTPEFYAYVLTSAATQRS